MNIPTPPPNPASNPNRLLLIGALGGAAAVLVLVVAVLIGYWLGRTNSPATPFDATTTTPSRVTAANIAAPSLLPTVITKPIDTADSEAVISTPIPADPALAAEEIDRHSDQQAQLASQKQTLSQQVTDSTQLIELKAEQIRLLEAELAKQP